MPHDFQLEKSGSSAVLVAFVDDWMLRFVEVDLTRKGVFYYLTSVIKRPRTRKPVREGVNLSEFVERRHGGFGGKPTISIKSLQWEGERLHVKLEISRLDIEREIYHLRRSNSGDWEDLSASLEQHHK